MNYAIKLQQARLKDIRAKDSQDVELRKSAQAENKYYNRMLGVLTGFQSPAGSEKSTQSEQSESEKAVELRRLQQESLSGQRTFSGSKKIPFKTKITLAQAYRRIKRHARPLWTINFAVALSLDFFVDILSMVPYVGWILGILIAGAGGIYLFCSLWRTGNRSARTKKRIMRVAMLLLDAIPYIGILPLSTATVYIAHRDSEKSANKAKRTIKGIQKKHPGVTVQ